MSQVPSKSRSDGSELENQVILRVPQVKLVGEYSLTS